MVQDVVSRCSNTIMNHTEPKADPWLTQNLILLPQHSKDMTPCTLPSLSLAFIAMHWSFPSSFTTLTVSSKSSSAQRATYCSNALCISMNLDYSCPFLGSDTQITQTDKHHTLKSVSALPKPRSNFLVGQNLTDWNTLLEPPRLLSRAELARIRLVIWLSESDLSSPGSDASINSLTLD